ncbi:MAG: GAF domain-containing protein [bacterium]
MKQLLFLQIAPGLSQKGKKILFPGAKRRSNFPISGTKPGDCFASLAMTFEFLGQLQGTLLLLLLLAQPLPAQTAEAGLPFITNFSPKEYNAGNNNWAIVQDDRGVMYFGNNSGVLEYDGASWRLIRLPNKSTARSLARAEDGTIYVGGVGDFGFLAPDGRGQMQCVSLREQAPADARQFADVWMTHVTAEGVYFLTDRRIFRWTPGEGGKHPSESPLEEERHAPGATVAAGVMRVWPAQDRFHVASVVHGDYYVRQWGVGLMRMENDSLALVPQGERFAGERIYVMLPYEIPPDPPLQKGGALLPNPILIGTRTQGLFLYDGQTFRPFKTEADDFLARGGIYLPGAVLADGSFALGTIVGGMAVIERDGRLRYVLDESSGLNQNGAMYIYPDPSGAGLWLGLNKGVAYVETPSPLTRYDALSGLEFPVYDILRHRGVLYVSGNYGVHRLDPERGRFQRVAGTSDQCFDLLVIDDELYVTILAHGLFRIEHQRAVPVRPSVNYDFRAQNLHPWRRNPDYLFVLLDDALAVLRHTGRRWRDVGKVPIRSSPYGLSEDASGDFWVGLANGAARIRLHSRDELDSTMLENARVDYHDTRHGLPTGKVQPYWVAGRTFFATLSGVYAFDAGSRRFHPDSTFAGVRSNPLAENFLLRKDAGGRVWISLGAESAVATPDGAGGYTVEKTPFLRFADSPPDVIYPEKASAGSADLGPVWFGGAEALIRYDPSVRRNYLADYPALIRRVTVGEDSVLFGGAAIPPGPPLQKGGEGSPLLKKGDLGGFLASTVELPHTQNALRFEFAAPTFDNPKETHFQSMLKGFDQRWSAWSKENKRIYTNLPAGDFRFIVRARNIYQRESSDAVYAFSILSPWWRTLWAYLFYLLAGGGLVFGLVRMRTQQLEARSWELEQTVAERTAEIQQRAEELAVINSVQEGLVAELEMQGIYDLVGDKIRQLFDAQVVVIRTFDLDTGLAHFQYVIEKGKRYYVDAHPIDGFHKHLLETGQPLLLKQKFVEYVRQYTDQVVVDGEAPKSAIFVPMQVSGTVKGNISLQNVDHEHAFSESDLRLLTTLANSMSVALENARLFSETTQRATELATVNNISRALVSQLEFDALVHLVGEQMRATFKANIVYVALLDKERSMIDFPYGYGDDFASIPLGQGLTSQIIQSGEPLLINKDLKQRHEEMGIDTVGVPAASYLGVPIPVGGEIIGVISVQSTEEENRFGEDDMRLLSTIAANVGVALQNAESYHKLNAALEDLKTTQEQLVTQEKLASLGALTAGIAHEIKNPLNFVNNFAELSMELVAEIRECFEQEKDKISAGVREDVELALQDLEQNAQKINEHGKRADSIVKSMLQHSRGKKGERQETDLNAVLEEALNLAYHGMRAQDSSFNIKMETHLEDKLPKISVVPQDISRVFLNIISNGFYAAHKKKNGSAGGGFSPTLTVATKTTGQGVEVRIRDNGGGIPKETLDKLFQPFFTTKPTGQGTGLGLSISYDIIVQEHGGELTFETEEGEFTEFIIRLPGNGT